VVSNVPGGEPVSAVLRFVGGIRAVRVALIEALRVVARMRGFSEEWRERIHWPIVQSVMAGDRTYRVRLKSGLLFDITAASVIEKNVLISPERHPDHIWEPYTTRLLVRLAENKRTVVVGGAYIGDQALPIARQIAHNGGTVYGFEPMERSYRMLKHNCALNAIQNVVAERAALWDRSGEVLELRGPPALARTIQSKDSLVEHGTPESCATTTIDEYMAAHGVTDVDLIMLDLEGGELRALQGASRQLSRPPDKASDVVFEIHRHYVDWSRGVNKTDIVLHLESLGYTVFGVRDYHHCYPVPDVPTELIPVAVINTDGPPHGFNMLATKRPEDLERLSMRLVREGGSRALSPKLLLRELHA
jgi:FkbM family methyltransferase